MPAIIITISFHSLRNFNHMSYMKNAFEGRCSKNALFDLALIMMQAGDLHPNPGPNKPKFPCNIFGKAARWNQRATCCDNCDAWYHVECMGMNTINYEALQGSEVSWICAHCSIPNFASSLFSNTSFELSNSFSSLSLATDCSGPLSPPLAASSPNQERLQSSRNRSRISSDGSKTSHNQSNKRSDAKKTSTLRRSIKLLVINFDSIRGKVADLAMCIETYNSDVIIGSDTHLNPSVNSSELFPDLFAVFRKNRCFGKTETKCGGILIALKNDIIETHRIDLDTECEVVWVTIKIQGAKDVTIGAFYRSQIFGKSVEYMNELRKSIQRTKRSNKGQIWLTGDFNMPDVNWETNSFIPGGSYPAISKEMLNISADFGLEQVVKGPTRANNTLDLFFTSNPTLVERSTTIPGISDHDSIPLIIISSKPKIMKKTPHKRYLYNKADMQALKKDLKNWSTAFLNQNTTNDQKPVSELYSEFTDSIEQLMDTYIPTKMVTKRTQSPWITKRVRRLHKRKQRAFNAHKKQNTSESYERFKTERKLTHNATKNAYKDYIASVCTESPKHYWSYIKSLKVGSVGIPTLRDGAKLEADNASKAEILNRQFKSVFTSEDPNLPHESGSNIPPMPDITICPEGVEKLLKNLDPNKATGPDNIGPRILQIAAEELAPALSLIFQRSLDTGDLPESWLRANISPIYKKGDRTLAENYRPVSLTSVCCKVLEHIIHSNIMHHFDTHSIFTDKQHGFRSKYSTESKLI